MKFIDFGDLVEITYDDESVKLVSKEEAVELGYKERNEIKISYKGQIYNSVEFANISKLSRNVIRKYYNLGFNTGEEILAYYEQQTTPKTSITYKNEVYTVYQFSKLTGINEITVQRYYKNGLHTGEEILAQYRKRKRKEIIEIPYQNGIYNCAQLEKLTGIASSVIHRYYHKGFRTGEEIVTHYNNSKQDNKGVTLTYKGQVCTVYKFAKLACMDLTTVYNYYNRGLKTGEEIITAYKKAKKIRITYLGELYNSSQFSKLTGIDTHTIRKYYEKGLRTGEEIIEATNAGKKKKAGQDIQIPYNGHMYNRHQFAQLIKISHQTVGNYYNKGYHTGEEIIAAYNKNNRGGTEQWQTTTDINS